MFAFRESPTSLKLFSVVQIKQSSVTVRMFSRMARLSPTVMTLLGCVMAVISASNVCYVDLGGCKYRVTLLTSTCSSELNDQPYPAEKADRNNSIAKADILSDHLERVEITLAEDAVSLKKLETLEQKLVKMMEDLSVRSLRHVREIRSDLRQMTQSMNQLQTSQQRGSAGGSNGIGRAGLKSLDHPGRPGSPSSVGFQRQCPPEFVGMGSWRSCYRFSNFEASWHDAREYCSAFDANLVSLESMKEAYIVDYLIKSKPGITTLLFL